MSGSEVRRVGLLVADLFEDLELWYPLPRLHEAGAIVVLGTGEASYWAKRGLRVRVDAPVESVEADDLYALVVPGGYAPDRLRRSPAVLDLVRHMHREGKPVAFICHAGSVLASAGILRKRRVTSFDSVRVDLENAGARWQDGAVVIDGNPVSGRSPEDLPTFGFALVRILAGERPPEEPSG
jgi:protease I